MNETELARLWHAYGPWGALAVILLGGGPISQAVYRTFRDWLGAHPHLPWIKARREVESLTRIEKQNEVILSRLDALEGKGKGDA